MKRLIIKISLVIAGLLACGALYEFMSARLEKKSFPASGKFIDVGGYKLNMNCSGSGTPSVILVSGMGADSSYWKPIQSAVAQFAHVCSYDRAGLGLSEASPHPRTARIMAEELHTLLHNAAIQPPYILAAHSYGGLIVRFFANIYPDDVYGLVLMDTVPDQKINDLFQELIKEIPLPKQTFFEPIRDYILCSKIAQYTGIARIVNILFKDYFLFKNCLPDDAGKDEALNAQESYYEMDKTINGLENKQLIVIRAGKSQYNPYQMSDQFMEKYNKLWEFGQNQLAQKSKHGKLIVAEKSGHVIPEDQPEIIIDSIREMVSQIRNNKLLM